ncbi:MAG: LPS export ABC transporter periplasmic protein LptC [Burkholderiales bacterium]|nr:LPS export ABC transporter periplasmic protein LptC [Burkholderiales bacterium]
MLERLTSSFPLLLLAALAGLTFWLDRAVQPPAPARDTTESNDPDYIVERLSAIRTNDKGIAIYTLTAERMVHYPLDDATVLERPRLVSHRSRQAPVTITAREALVSSNGEDVYFRDDVKLTRAAHGTRSELTMRTAYLHVIPEDHVARTNMPVTITDAATVVNAVGLEFNSETRVLTLLSNVRGTYDPAKASRRGPER